MQDDQIPMDFAIRKNKEIGGHLAYKLHICKEENSEKNGKIEKCFRHLDWKKYFILREYNLAYQRLNCPTEVSNIPIFTW